ncbi:MAG: hypothetical protein ACRD9L_20505, partial [Bryobacteraceae bacterium]
MRVILPLLAASLLQAANTEHDRVQRRFDAIEQHKVRRGAELVFTQHEINAWAAVAAPKAVPQGLRQPHIQLGQGTATGFALVDFVKIQQSRGKTMNWFMTKLLSGEKPVSVTVEMQSAYGQATVFLRSVQISGTAITGSVLDFLVKTFFLPEYPDAQIDRPFELADGIERIGIQPHGVV